MSTIKNILFILILLLLNVSLKAQYADNKLKYNSQSYSYSPDDRYHPAIAGVASYVLPGLGQIYCNETKRGFNFMAGYGGAILVVMTGGLIQSYHNMTGKNNSTGTILFASGAITAYGIQIWSCIDAVHVSKVNNMALREKKTTGYLFKLSPCFTTLYDSKINFGLTGGITF